jgi:hypothetical protein
LFVEPSKSNYARNYNANPDAALTNMSVTSGYISRVLDVDLISDSGLAAICTSGYVWRYANRTASTQTITITSVDVPAAGSQVALSLFGYSEVLPCTMQLTGGTGAVPVPLGSLLSRVKSEAIAQVNTTDDFQIVVPAGAAITWVLNQHEGWATNQTLYPTSCSSPIITVGGAAVVTRAATTTQINIPAGVISSSSPSTEYGFYMEVSGSSWQTSQPVYASLLATGNNSRSQLLASGQYSKRDSTAAYNTTKEGCINPTERPSKLFYYNSGTTSQISMNGVGTRTANLNTGGTMDYSGTCTLYLGYSNTGSIYNYFQGQIKGVELYNATITQADANLKSATATFDNIGVMGCVLYDNARDGRIWALGGWNGTNFTNVNYSDNYGSSWILYATLNNVSGSTGTLCKDASGNLYHGSSGVGAGLYRIANSGTVQNPVAGTQSLVITWTPNGAGQSYTFLPWSWAEDGLGNIYTAGYMGALNGQDAAIIQKSSDGGLTWSPISLAATFPKGATYTHIHALRYDTYSGRLYVAVGDDAVAGRGVAYSTNQGSSWTIVTDALNKGPTALSFSSELGVEFSDNVGSANAVNYIDTTPAMARLFSMPLGYTNSPLYMGSFRGNNEMWVLSWPETYASGTGKFSVLTKYTKNTGATYQFSAEQQIMVGDPDSSSGNSGYVFYTLGHDGSASIPEWARYVFCTVTNSAQTPQYLARIATGSTYESSGSGSGGILSGLLGSILG